MTSDEANILRYLEEKNYRATSVIARYFRWDLPAAEIRLRSLLKQGCLEEDAKRYYRIVAKGIEALTDFDDHWKIVPFDGSRPVV